MSKHSCSDNKKRNTWWAIRSTAGCCSCYGNRWAWTASVKLGYVSSVQFHNQQKKKRNNVSYYSQGFCEHDSGTHSDFPTTQWAMNGSCNLFLTTWMINSKNGLHLLQQLNASWHEHTCIGTNVQPNDIYKLIQVNVHYCYLVFGNTSLM